MARPVLLPKGLLVRGSGSSATSVTVQSKQGQWSFAPMRIPFGASEKYLGGRVEVKRIPPATDLSGTSCGSTISRHRGGRGGAFG